MAAGEADARANNMDGYAEVKGPGWLCTQTLLVPPPSAVRASVPSIFIVDNARLPIVGPDTIDGACQQPYWLLRLPSSDPDDLNYKDSGHKLGTGPRKHAKCGGEKRKV